MSDNTGTTDQASTAATDQASTTDDTTKSQALKTIDDLPDWAQKEIKSLRKESGDFRTRLQKIEDRDKSELQKAQERAAELEKLHGETVTALQHERAERLVTVAASKANATRPDAIYRLIRESIEFEDGKPTNVDAAIAQARKDYPEFFRVAAGSGDGGKNGDTPKDKNQAANDAIRALAGR